MAKFKMMEVPETGSVNEIKVIELTRAPHVGEYI